MNLRYQLAGAWRPSTGRFSQTRSGALGASSQRDPLTRVHSQQHHDSQADHRRAMCNPCPRHHLQNQVSGTYPQRSLTKPMHATHPRCFALRVFPRSPRPLGARERRRWAP